MSSIRLLSCLLLLLVIGVAVAPSTSAQQVAIGSFDAGGWSGNDYVYDWLPFTPTVTAAVTSVSSQLFACANGTCNSNSPAFYVICSVNGGTYNGCPTNSVVATSDASFSFNPCNGNCTFALLTFTFSGANQVALQAGQTYYVRPYICSFAASYCGGGQALAGGLQTFEGIPSQLSQLSTGYEWSSSGALVYTSAIRFDAGVVTSFQSLTIAAGNGAGMINPTLGWNCDGDADNGFTGSYVNPLSAHCLNTATALSGNVTPLQGVNYFEISSPVPILLSGIVEFAWQQAGSNNWGTNTSPLPGVYFDVFTCATDTSAPFCFFSPTKSISDSLPLPYFVWIGQTTQGPSIATITPPFANFPSDQTTLTVNNTGGSMLNISADPLIAGSNAVDFSVDRDTTCSPGLAIPPQGSCVIVVDFAPDSGSQAAVSPFGTWEAATLALLDDSGTGIQTVPLSAGGQLAGVAPNPPPASISSQMITVTGTNFQPDVKVVWQDLTNPWETTPPQSIIPSSISSNAMTVPMNFLTIASAIWQIEAVNSDGTTSNWFPF